MFTVTLHLIRNTTKMQYLKKSSLKKEKVNHINDISPVVLSLNFTLRILYFSKILVKAATAFPENNCFKEVS